METGIRTAILIDKSVRWFQKSAMTMKFPPAVINWQDKILILPMADMWTYIGIGIFVLILLTLFLFSFRIITRRAAKDTRWNLLLAYLLRHDLVTKEIELIRELYVSVPLATQEEMITSKRRLHQMVYDKLLTRNDLDMEERVMLMEKLFPPFENIAEIKTLSDIAIGEICAVESGNEKFLGAVVKKWPDELLVSVENFDTLTIGKGSEIGIYFFRHNIGGFTVMGAVKQMGPDFIILKFDGRVEQKSGHHFMAEISCDIVFKPWPTPDKDDKSAGHIIRGITKLFSDRNLLFIPKNEEDVPYYLNRHEVWSMQTKLPEGYIFACRGMIKKSEDYEKSYVFKYLDASETSRNVLYVEIQNHNPVKENIR